MALFWGVNCELVLLAVLVVVLVWFVLFIVGGFTGVLT